MARASRNPFLSVSTFGRSRGFRERSCGNDIVSSESESECERSEQRAHTKPQWLSPLVVATGQLEKTEIMDTIVM